MFFHKIMYNHPPLSLHSPSGPPPPAGSSGRLSGS